MQVNPLPASAQADLRLSEDVVPGHPSGKAVAPPEPAVPLPENPSATAAVLPEPNRVSVSVDETREFVYRFVDARTGDVVAQVPSEAVLKVVREIQGQLKAEENRKTAVVNVQG